MHKTPFSKKVEILADFWQLSQMDVADYPIGKEVYIDEALDNCSDILYTHKEFFILAQHIFSENLVLSDIPAKTLLEMSELFSEFCDNLNLGFDNSWSSLSEMIEDSSNVEISQYPY
jgi:hypothetical protein